MTDNADLIACGKQVLENGQHFADARDNQAAERIAADSAAIASLTARVAETEAALQTARGYMLNAKIDLETGAPKRTAIVTLDGGLNRTAAALKSAQP